MEGINTVTRDEILRRVAKVAQARTTNFGVVGQYPFSRNVNLACIRIEVKMLHNTESTRTWVALPLHPALLSSKIVSSPPVVGVSVLLRRRTRI